MGQLEPGTEFSHGSKRFKKTSKGWIGSALLESKTKNSNILSEGEILEDSRVMACSPLLGGHFQTHESLETWFDVATVVFVE